MMCIYIEMMDPFVLRNMSVNADDVILSTIMSNPIPYEEGVAVALPKGRTVRFSHGDVEIWAFVVSDGEESRNGEKGEKIKERDLPSKEDAQRIISTALKEDSTPQKRTWGSYIPSFRGKGKEIPKEDQRKWKTWGEYIPASLANVTGDFHPDPTAPYLAQLLSLSRTPIGAASLAALSGSGSFSSLYAGYQAYTALHPLYPPPEFLSLPHTRERSGEINPRPGNVLLSNKRNEILTLVEGEGEGLWPACGAEEGREEGTRIPCEEKFGELVKKRGVKVEFVPTPLRLNGGTLRAERDVLLFATACERMGRGEGVEFEVEEDGGKVGKVGKEKGKKAGLVKGNRSGKKGGSVNGSLVRDEKSADQMVEGVGASRKMGDEDQSERKAKDDAEIKGDTPNEKPEVKQRKKPRKIGVSMKKKVPDVSSEQEKGRSSAETRRGEGLCNRPPRIEIPGGNPSTSG
ncbi:hypothetical protein K470DRAFT_80138 [Piedraia hortae CBS 480.64]|uniref:Uncharacterized protein n=1 Tax=Piedraia hortae CBS 480.64 TaxID=1314780 RepID=A0A6A7BYQ8_9PEZI|nr:hypothetical protein K470DRAFT_80138 [Piedraia hortae CBS 480.64]